MNDEGRLVLKSVDELKSFEDEEEKEKYFLLIDSYCIDTITVPGGHKRDIYYPEQNLFDLSQVEDIKCKFFNYKHLDAASRTFHEFYDKERFELYLNFGNITCEISRIHNNSWIDVSIENKGAKTFASLHHDASERLKLLSKNFLSSKKKEKKELSKKHKVSLKQLKDAKCSNKKDDIKRFGQQIHDLENEKFKLKSEISSLEKGGTGWKIHISVDDTDTASMLNAWNILLYCSIKHGMPSFKVKTLTGESKRQLNLYIGGYADQIGKAFTVYFGPSELVLKNICHILTFLSDVHNKFLECNVAPGCKLGDDDHTLTEHSPYFYYRNDSDNNGFYCEVKGDGSAFNSANAKDPFIQQPPFTNFKHTDLKALPIDSYYNKALLLAVFYRDCEAIPRLLDLGAKTNQSHPDPRNPAKFSTPLSVAQELGYKDVVDLLEAAERLRLESVSTGPGVGLEKTHRFSVFSLWPDNQRNEEENRQYTDLSVS